MDIDSGDILLISGQSLLIKIATFSRWTHAGIAIDKHHILEANIENAYEEPHKSGLYKTKKEKFLSKGKRAVLIRRINPKPIDEISLFISEYISTNKNKPYTVHGAGSSGLPPILRNLIAGYFGVLSLLYLIVFSISENFSALYALTTALGLGLVCWPLIQISMKHRERNDKHSAFLKTIGFSEKILNSSDHLFCSKTVADLDEKLGGIIKKKLSRTHQARPSDLLRICKKDKNYNVYNL